MDYPIPSLPVCFSQLLDNFENSGSLGEDDKNILCVIFEKVGHYIHPFPMLITVPFCLYLLFIIIV